MYELEQNTKLLTKRERKMLRSQQREKEQEKRKQGQKIKKLFSISIVVLIIGGGVFGFGWYFSSKPPTSESDIITRDGIHWHPEIKIFILGKIQEIPANIGFGVIERPIHTHDNMGVAHLEFQGFVKKDDVRLGKFFEIWGKQFNKACIFNKCNGSEGQLKMLVNGKPNLEFENYVMRDKDKIEIVFE